MAVHEWSAGRGRPTNLPTKKLTRANMSESSLFRQTNQRLTKQQRSKSNTVLYVLPPNRQRHFAKRAPFVYGTAARYTHQRGALKYGPPPRPQYGRENWLLHNWLQESNMSLPDSVDTGIGSMRHHMRGPIYEMIDDVGGRQESGEKKQQYSKETSFFNNKPDKNDLPFYQQKQTLRPPSSSNNSTYNSYIFRNIRLERSAKGKFGFNVTSRQYIDKMLLPQIDAILPGSSASRNGIVIGDFIHLINRVSVEGIEMQEFLHLVANADQQLDVQILHLNKTPNAAFAHEPLHTNNHAFSTNFDNHQNNPTNSEANHSPTRSVLVERNRAGHYPLKGGCRIQDLSTVYQDTISFNIRRGQYEVADHSSRQPIGRAAGNTNRHAAHSDHENRYSHSQNNYAHGANRDAFKRAVYRKEQSHSNTSKMATEMPDAQPAQLYKCTSVIDIGSVQDILLIKSHPNIGLKKVKSPTVEESLESVENWSVGDVAMWFKKIGLVDLEDIVRRERLDGKNLLRIDRSKMLEMGITDVHQRFKTEREILKLKKEVQKNLSADRNFPKIPENYLIDTITHI